MLFRTERSFKFQLQFLKFLENQVIEIPSLMKA